MSRRPLSEDMPAIGMPLHDRFAANIADALEPALQGRVELQAMLTGRTLLMGTGDRRPPVLRPGCMRANTLPSRTGRWLRWPDGRVTGLNGELQP